MTCKDCLYYEVCPLGLAIKGSTGTCLKFKNKADYAEVKHGEWVVDKDKEILHIGKNNKTRCITYKCSECGAKSGNNKSFKFCHNCGAKMKGV